MPALHWFGVETVDCVGEIPGLDMPVDNDFPKVTEGDSPVFLIGVILTSLLVIFDFVELCHRVRSIDTSIGIYKSIGSANYICIPSKDGLELYEMSKV